MRVGSRPGEISTAIALGHERARVQPWRGHPEIAHLAPQDVGDHSAAFIDHCCERLEALGYKRVVTTALDARSAGHWADGFEVLRRLHLLRRDLSLSLPKRCAGDARVRRSPSRAEVLEVDSASFDDFWRFDERGLDDAIRATPHSRLRGVDAPAAAYAIFGRAGRDGYVQRIAVAPGCRRRGIGRALLLDGLRWLARWAASSAVVNTQTDNDAAIALYESHGFRIEPRGLVVLGRDLR